MFTQFLTINASSTIWKKAGSKHTSMFLWGWMGESCDHTIRWKRILCTNTFDISHGRLKNVASSFLIPIFSRFRFPGDKSYQLINFSYSGYFIFNADIINKKILFFRCLWWTIQQKVTHLYFPPSLSADIYGEKYFFFS